MIGGRVCFARKAGANVEADSGVIPAEKTAVSDLAGARRAGWCRPGVHLEARDGRRVGLAELGGGHQPVGVRDGNTERNSVTTITTI